MCNIYIVTKQKSVEIFIQERSAMSLSHHTQAPVDNIYVTKKNTHTHDGTCICDCMKCSHCSSALYKIQGGVDPRFMSASPVVRGSILKMYYIMIDNAEITLKPTTTPDVNQQQQHYDEMRAYYEKVIQGLREDAVKLREDREMYAMEIRRQLHTECTLELQKKQLEVDHCAEKMSHLNEMNEMLRKEAAAMALAAAAAQTNPSTPQYSSNTNKGEVGEDMIVAYLETVAGTVVTKTANKAMSTDVWCAYGGHCNVMIESKHVKKVKKTELDKFYRDVDENRGGMDGAIFVSISEGVRIPHKMTYFDCELRDGRVPCIFVSNFENNNHLLFAALQWIKLYKQRCGDKAYISRMVDAFRDVMQQMEIQTEAVRMAKCAAKTMHDNVMGIEAGMRKMLQRMTASLENEMPLSLNTVSEQTTTEFDDVVCVTANQPSTKATRKRSTTSSKKRNWKGENV